MCMCVRVCSSTTSSARWWAAHTHGRHPQVCLVSSLKVPVDFPGGSRLSLCLASVSLFLLCRASREVSAFLRPGRGKVAGVCLCEMGAGGREAVADGTLFTRPKTRPKAACLSRTCQAFP